MTIAPALQHLSDSARRKQGRNNGDASDKNEAVRVCFVIDNLARAGTESQLLLLLKQLDRTKVVPYLCLLDGQDEVSQALEPVDVSLLRLGVRRLIGWHALRQAFKFRRFLRKERIEIVHLYFIDSTRFAAPVAKAAGVRAVFGSRRNIGHWMTAKDRWIARIYNRLFIDKIVANCEAARQAVIEQEGAKPEQVIVLPNGIDLDRFKDIPPWEPKPAGQLRKVGMVGNLRPIKGVDLFIRAAQLVLMEHPQTQFEIAGGGDPAPYQELIDELGLTNNVRLLGPIDDVPEFLATLDLAVLPSRAEGLSNALLEYMAAGRPIVATDVGGNAFALGPISQDCAVAGHDSAALADGVSRILGDDFLASKLAASAQRRVATVFCEQRRRDYFQILCE